MDINVIQKMVDREPFIPFFLRMNDGREFYIDNPDCITTAVMDVLILSLREGLYHHLDPILIASLHYPSTAE